MIALLLAADVASRLIASARDQTTWGTRYDPAYVRIRYPNGDVPRSMGVCTDVVVRAYRRAGFDLQRLIHEDMRRAWRAYPRYPGLAKPDPNIDHRRVPNQAAFFRRHGRTLSISGGWKPGDLVWWKLPNGRDHIGVLTDRVNARGLPWVVHNIGVGPQEENVLTTWRVMGHYRYPK